MNRLLIRRSPARLRLLLVFCVSLGAAFGHSSENSRGQRIFYGEEPMRGKIEGHVVPLPASFTSCANCHASAERSRLDQALEERTAPQLNRGGLLETRSRRGGPPFAYDEQSFCHTIQTGVDPRYVTLARAMPRFEVDQSQCEALWEYLTNDKRQHEY